jgi:hypothetical protein
MGRLCLGLSSFYMQTIFIRIGRFSLLFKIICEVMNRTDTQLNTFPRGIRALWTKFCMVSNPPNQFLWDIRPICINFFGVPVTVPVRSGCGSLSLSGYLTLFKSLFLSLSRYLVHVLCPATESNMDTNKDREMATEYARHGVTRFFALQV